jgi:hypothetical protein
MPYGMVRKRADDPHGRYWLQVASAANTTAEAVPSTRPNRSRGYRPATGQGWDSIVQAGISRLSWIFHTLGTPSRPARSTPMNAAVVFAITALMPYSRARAASSASFPSYASASE